jgi:hypothetical protein
LVSNCARRPIAAVSSKNLLAMMTPRSACAAHPQGPSLYNKTNTVIVP